MKKLLTALSFLIFISPAHAAGPFDGIYTFNFNGTLVGYTSIHEVNGVVIAIILEPSPFDATWEAVQGVRNGNTVRFNSIAGTVNLVVDVTFNGDNVSASATIQSCSDKDNDPSNDSDNCDFPPGTVLNLEKVF